MHMIKVYDADGKCVERFHKPTNINSYPSVKGPSGQTIALNAAQLVQYLNANGFWVKGQTTNKGVKIK